MCKLIKGSLLALSFLALAVAISKGVDQKPVHSRSAHALEASASEAVFHQVPAIIGAEENKYEKQYDWKNKN